MNVRTPLLSATLAVALVSCGKEAPTGAVADTVYSGGVIVTMDDTRPMAEAVAVRDGRILAVGDVEEVLAHAGPTTRRVDLSGQTMLPGFFDSHGHVFAIGTQVLSANLLPPPDGPGRNIAAVQAELAAWAANA